MEFRRIKIKELVAASYNPRKKLKPGDMEYEKIKRSIQEFGYVEPVIVNSDLTIIGGHQRVTVLSDLGDLVEDTKELYALQERHAAAYVCVTISGCKGLLSDEDFRTDYFGKVDRNEINCMPIEIHDITDNEMVDEAINKCKMIINYSLGRRK